jgi:cytidylate kinase
MIDELTIKMIRKFDKRFGTRSKVFSATNSIVVETGLDIWLIQITNRKYKGIYLYHQNKLKQTKKYHHQGIKSNLYQVYHSIFKHKNWLHIMVKPNNTYLKGEI